MARYIFSRLCQYYFSAKKQKVIKIEEGVMIIGRIVCPVRS